MKKKRVGVLRGGPGSHYRESLESGQVILNNMPEEFEAVDIFVDTRGVWHMNGLPVTLTQVREDVDVLVNALHGSYGSDGQLQRQLELHHIPYTGSSVTGSANAYQRKLSKELLAQHEIRTPHGIIIHAQEPNWKEMTHRFFLNHPGPYVVKRTEGHGSSQLARTYSDMVDLVESYLHEGNDVIIEEHINGSETLVGVLDRYRGERYYTAIPSRGSSPEVEALARKAHTTLGLRDYSLVHIVDGRRGPFVIKVDAHPVLKEGAQMPRALDAVGCSYTEFIQALLD